MEYLAQFSCGLPPYYTRLMPRGVVTQAGRDTQHRSLAYVGTQAIVDTVVFVPKLRFSRSVDKIIDLKPV